ncbi:5'-methylthioadenosine/adenosylhomocysteine nucleosidase [Geosporobacter ferrireducens]|uniref:adenosylhomocysteine nucleosidase n=1 Tax=Geosporobacter ferrireducens TaxID=1424294 RepID=A0A1D8GC23_9FIRM|nr:5'-methylthioadenosine/adenosylhomocysteine nucleosidase [Geosporobacter ferrireducens]AOT68432.1 5'-methylthioadenosine/S-adenosylhomocysteine nucleosidase [Geosporobacter ferrireducens]MTI53888.1 5'-methylthioadenosine/adenosylhomocysteine nucleosidase [Geosporobacter ferrireducens]
MGIIGIIGAMDEEIHILKGKMELTETIELAGMKFHKGQLKDKAVVLVRSGIGKVNAAVCAQILISNFDVSTIINTGVAGAVHDALSVGDIVISSDVIEHDFDVTGFGGYKLGQIPRMDEYIFKADKKIIDIALNASKKENENHKTMVGRILSGDIFVASREKKDLLWGEFQGYCTEMEGAAIGHTCYLNQVPFVIIRAMSDKADGSAHVNFNEFVHQAANHSSQIVIDMIQHM